MNKKTNIQLIILIILFILILPVSAITGTVTVLPGIKEQVSLESGGSTSITLPDQTVVEITANETISGSIIIRTETNITNLNTSIDRTFGLATGQVQLDRYVQIETDNITTSQISSVNLTISYTDADVNGIDENTLKIFWWNGSIWKPLDPIGIDYTLESGPKVLGITRDIVNNKLTVQLNHLSIFALVGSTITASVGSSGSSGGSGGGGVVTDEDLKNINNYQSIEGNLQAGKEVRYDFNKVGAGIFYAVVTGKENEYDITIRVENLKAQPKKATSPAPNIVYLYTNILSGSQRMASAKIGFKVANTWFDSNKIDPNTVKMYRLIDGKWNVQETRLVGNDAENSIYEASTTEFSKFAITGEVPQALEMPTVVPTPVQTAVTETTPEQTPAPIVTPQPQTPGFNAIIGLIGLLFAIYIRNKRQ